MFRYFAFLIFQCAFTFIHAQLNVSATSNATALVNNIVGQGVQVSSVSMNCNGQASATFTANGTNLGLSSGIILATGNAVEAVGPNNSTGGSLFTNDGCFNTGESFFDANILSLENLAKYDGCVLEFDVKPVCSTLNINYVFASEEYPEYVGAGYNDVFGFFVTGPNPSGGNYVNYNIARLSNGTVVSIDNINNASNSAYYVDNTNGNSIEFDGFTVPLVAAVGVVPCANYHLKLAIADAGDCLYSSAVFLSYKGLTCPNNQVPSLSSSSTAISCGNDGTATVNVSNYTGPLTYLWQPGGQTGSTATGLGAGTYTCTVSYSLPCPYTQTVTVNVSGQNILDIITSSTNAYCNNPTGTATAVASGGVLPYSVLSWSTNPIQTGNNISQLAPGSYTVSVTDASGCVVNETVTIGNDEPLITITDSIVNATCNQSNGAAFVLNVNGGSSPYQYTWTGATSTSTSIVQQAPGSYTVTVTDNDNCTGSKTITILNLNSLPVQLIEENEKCLQGNGSITLNVLNGTGTYNYFWSHDSLLNTSQAVNLAAGNYIYTVIDASGCFYTDSSILVNVNEVFTGAPYTVPIEPNVNIPFELNLNPVSGWTLTGILYPDSTYGTTVPQQFVFEEYGDYSAEFYLISDSGCLDTVKHDFFVKDEMTLYIPNAFSPNKDNINDLWQVYGTIVREIKIIVFDRWGNEFFESNSLREGWDGTFKGKACPEDVYIYKIVAKDYYEKKFYYYGTITLIR